MFLTVALASAINAQASSATNFAKGLPEASGPAIERVSKRLPVGERLVFDVYWMGFRVGTGSLEVKEILRVNGRSAYHVVAVAQTNEVLSKIYPIYDEIHSKIDAETFHSYAFSKNIREGRYRADEEIVFDPEKHKGFYESFLNKSRKEFDISPSAQDFLSIFYWFRVQDIRLGESVRAVISDKGNDYEVALDVLKKEKKRLPGGRQVWTLQVEPKTRYKEVLYQRGRGWVYFTLDRSRTPVLIRISTPFGPVTGVLKDVKYKRIN